MSEKPEETTKLEDLNKEDLIERCRELEYWNLRMVDHNQDLRLRIGQHEEIFECYECKKTVLIKLVRMGGGYGSSTETVTQCSECHNEISNIELKFT